MSQNNSKFTNIILPPLKSPSPDAKNLGSLPPLSKISLPPVASTSLSTLEIEKSPSPPISSLLPPEGKTEMSQTVTLPPLAIAVKSALIKPEDIFTQLPSSPKESIVILSPSIEIKPLSILHGPIVKSPVKIILSAGSQPTFSGEGGLPKVEQLKTLQIAQEGVGEAKLIESEAAFQEKTFTTEIDTTLPPLVISPVTETSSLIVPPVSLVSGTSLPKIALQPLPESKIIVLPPLTLPESKTTKLPLNIENFTIPTPSKEVPLPTKRLKKAGTIIRIPKIKSTAVKPSPRRPSKKIFVSPLGIEFPKASTIIPSIPITSPATIKTSKIKKAKTEQSQVIKNLKSVDSKKLSISKTKKNNNSYTVAELRSIAGSLNLIKSGNKKQLVERIKALKLKHNPASFD